MSEPQFAYVVVHHGETPFLQMMYVSVLALRRVHPSSNVVALCDPRTREAVHTEAPDLEDVVDDWRVHQVGQPSPMLVSRSLKTRMRQLLDGDFLFLDVDAIPRRAIDAPFRWACDLAASYNYNRAPKRYLGSPGLARLATAWSGRAFPRDAYFASGLMYWADTPAARELANRWHELWLEDIEPSKGRDMPALNRAIVDLQPVVRPLPGNFHAIMDKGLYRGRNPRVLHFFTSNWHKRSYNVLYGLVESYRATGRVDREGFDEFMRTGYPLVDRDYVACQWHNRGALAAAAALLRKLGRLGRARPDRQTDQSSS